MFEIGWQIIIYQIFQDLLSTKLRLGLLTSFGSTVLFINFVKPAAICSFVKAFEKILLSISFFTYSSLNAAYLFTDCSNLSSK
ncbi:hypothetical protein [Rickettsia endosymbiont of Rhinocyllus conicus]|uniref:hypothetical protein n=1 Tax=Rickettsia endosymbiont of Rhinocyllus conicus TaxID=3066252 RepID=UPI003132A467